MRFLTGVFLCFITTQVIHGQIERLDSILFATAKIQLKEDIYGKLDKQLPTFEFFSHAG